MPKGVLSSQRGFLTNLPTSSAGRLRAALRNGEKIPIANSVNPLPQVASLLATRMFGPSELIFPINDPIFSIALFHVTGNTSTLVRLCTHS